MISQESLVEVEPISSSLEESDTCQSKNQESDHLSDSNQTETLESNSILIQNTISNESEAEAEAQALAELEKDAQIQDMELKNQDSPEITRTLTHSNSISRSVRDTWIKKQEEELILEAKLRKQQEQLAKFEQEQELIKVLYLSIM